MRWSEAADAAEDLWNAESWSEAYEASKRVAGASFEDSTADELGEYAGLWEDKPAGYYSNPIDPYGDYYGGGAPPHYGDHDMSQVPIDIYPQPVPQGGGGDLQVQVINPSNPSLPVSAAQAAAAVIQLVLREPSILQGIKQAIGGVIRRAPSSPGGGDLNPFALKLILAQMDDDYLMPIAQFLAGLDTPIGLSKKQQQVFLALLVSDGMDAMGIIPDPRDF